MDRLARLDYFRANSRPEGGPDRVHASEVGSQVGLKDLSGALAPDGWLGHRTQDRFVHLEASSVSVCAREAGRFFARRSLRSPCDDCDERTLAQELVAVDLRGIAHAASFLLSEPAEAAARRLLRDALGTDLAEDPPQLDHVGLEVFGRLEWYVSALEAWARRGAVRLLGYRVFPSVQVRRALDYDPELADVRIARVWLESEGRRVNLEIFEVTQHWLFTAARQLATFAREPLPRVAALLGELGEEVALPLVPVGHLALAVSRRRTLEAVDCILADPRHGAPAARAYAGGLSYNPGDQSLNTKFRAGGGPIIELIQYGARAPRSGQRSRLRALGAAVPTS